MECNIDKKILNSVLLDAKSHFAFMELSDSDILNVINKINIDLNSKTSIKKEVNKYYYKIISEQVKMKDFTLIYKYISYINEEDGIKFVDILSKFLSNLDVDITLDMYEKIFEESPKLREILVNIFSENQIDQDTINSLSASYITQSILGAYCVINGIDIECEEKDEDKKSIKYGNVFDIYLREISKYPVLSTEKERELLVRYKNLCDMSAREILINCNARLVVSIAKKYYRNYIQIMDLVSEGNIALMDAIDKFDITKPYKLSTHATWWIRQRIMRFIDSYDVIRIPVYKKQELLLYQKAKDTLFKKLEREASIEELAKKLRLPVYKINEYERLLKPVHSINIQYLVSIMWMKIWVNLKTLFLILILYMKIKLLMTLRLII